MMPALSLSSLALASPFKDLYSDTDDGRKQKRLISTSTFEYGNANTVGHFFIP